MGRNKKYVIKPQVMTWLERFKCTSRASIKLALKKKSVSEYLLSINSHFKSKLEIKWYSKDSDIYLDKLVKVAENNGSFQLQFNNSALVILAWKCMILTHKIWLQASHTRNDKMCICRCAKENIRQETFNIYQCIKIMTMWEVMMCSSANRY